MFDIFFDPNKVSEVFRIVRSQFPLAIWETFYVTVIASTFAVIIGVPLGVLLVAGGKSGIFHLPKLILKVINFIINLLRSIPFLILIIVLIPFTRAIVGTSVGTTASVVPLVIAAFPFVARIVETSLREVNSDIIEMAKSMGASPFQIIVKVMIPECMPSLVSNVTITVTTILGYSAMSGIVGGGGLGKIAINYGYYRYQYPTMLLAVIALIVLVQVFQSIGQYIAVKIDKRLKNT